MPAVMANPTSVVALAEVSSLINWEMLVNTYCLSGHQIFQVNSCYTQNKMSTKGWGFSGCSICVPFLSIPCTKLWHSAAVIFHPSYLLNNDSNFETCWRGLCGCCCLLIVQLVQLIQSCALCCALAHFWGEGGQCWMTLILNSSLFKKI